MRRIKRATVEFLSLVPKGANKMPVLYKQDDTGNLQLEIQTLTKASDAFDEKGEILCLGWVPNRVDAVGDFAGPECVKGMCHSFMQKGAKLDIRHNGKPLSKEQVCVVENFLVQKGDPRFADWKDYDGKTIDATDSWGALLKVTDPEIKRLYREGKWNGVSFGSFDFELEPITKEDKPAPGKGDPMLTKEDIEKMIAAGSESLLKIIEQKFAPKPDPKAPETPGIFKGDPTKLEDVRRHAAELKRQALVKSIDFSDPVAVEALAKQLEEEEASRRAGETSEQRAERLAKELAQTKVALEKAQKVSSIPATDSGTTTPAPDGLTKEDAAAIEAGKRIAAAANTLRQKPRFGFVAK